MRSIYLLLFFSTLSFISTAHEEPSKTLHEQREKAKLRDQIAKSGIIKSTIWKFTICDGKIPENGSKVIVQEYDRRGNMTAIEAFKNDSLSERVEYSFDLNNNMLTDIDYSANRKMLENNVYKFDQDGRLISGECFDENNHRTDFFNIRQGKDKKTITYSKFKQDDSLDYSLEYQYTFDFDLSDYIEANKYDSNNKLMLHVVKKHNTDGLQTEKAIYGSDTTLSYTFYYDYESNGNIHSITKKNSNDTIEWKDVFSYDSNGNCKEINSYDAKGQLKTLIRYVYELRSAEPKIIAFDPKSMTYQQLLDGENDSVVFYSGLVSLAPNESGDVHNTEIYEEIIIPLEGEGQLNITNSKNLPVQFGKIAFVPPHREHYVSNIGKTNFRYIYIATKSK